MAAKVFGATLTRLRVSHGLSQDDLAEKLCASSGRPTITRGEVSRWERGMRLPSDFWLRHLAKVLDVSADELVAVRNRSRGSEAQGGGPIRLDSEAHVSLTFDADDETISLTTRHRERDRATVAVSMFLGLIGAERSRWETGTHG